MDHETTPSSPSRRNFVTGGLAGLAGLGLAGASAHALAHAGEHYDLFDVPMDGDDYALPELPYDYDALEPHLDAETQRLHHSIHFNGYKNGLNGALKNLAQAREEEDFAYVQYWQGKLAFHGAGYFLHVVFFDGMAPEGETSASGNVKRVMGQHFGSFEGFQKHFSAAARTVEGSGWAILGYQPAGKKFIVMQAEKHQLMTQWHVIPVLALDVWEHAYYLKFQNKRGDYISNWWNVVDWDKLEKRIEAAMVL